MRAPCPIVSAASPLACLHRARARLRGTWLVVTLGLGLTGCPGEPEGPVRPFEVGTGPMFTALQEGDTVELHSGFQGGQHVFVSLRAWELATLKSRVELSLERTSDGDRVSSSYEVDLRFSPSPQPGEPAQLEGLLLVVPDASAAVGQEVRLSASFESDTGEHGSDSRTVVIQWASDLEP